MLSKVIDLFEAGEWDMHSGQHSDFKIECDALTIPDWYTVAYLAQKILPSFNEVVGVPSGGMVLAQQLERYATPQEKWGELTTIVCDDVLTTGASMEQVKQTVWDMISWPQYGGDGQLRHIHGIVLFARGPCPSWIAPIFTLNEQLGA